MYQIILNGAIETENPEEFVQKLDEFFKSQSVTWIGNSRIVQLPPYVDYQKCDDE